ncbi:hypothetical protein NLM33_27175 [Bradyrhizobium sp. CCGUVB1N3]|uniref:hypothetical protein n=1 Tax=Bradyrhizobium sp. CCGUVB1N3 TaxID=2949629 RepID=UPI0020B27256|nr:hypothetical protein [Bradyrhizobium sp. CCGUVB1N3]MCP3474001.1 hypothetical protein [Bradyrhizobium sp. CCGUVB1N3]
MRPVVKLAVGFGIIAAAWIPYSLTTRYDIPFGEAIIGFAGSAVGTVMILVALVQGRRAN